MMKRTFGVALAIAATVTGCGGDSDKESAPSASTTALGPPATGSPSPSFAGDKDSRFCQLGAEFAPRFQGIGDALRGGAERLRTELTAVRAVVGEAEAVAPASVKADLQVLAENFNRFFTEAEAGGFQPSAVASAASKLTVPEVQTAIERMEQYATQVCGIRPGS